MYITTDEQLNRATVAATSKDVQDVEIEEERATRIGRFDTRIRKGINGGHQGMMTIPRYCLSVTHQTWNRNV